MSEFYSYEGLRNGGTFLLDDTTKTTIKSNPNQLVGKVVSLVGNYKVGYGTSGDNPLGFVESVELEKSGSDQFVVAVVWNQSREDIKCVGSETANSYVACDGSGGIVLSGTTSAPKPSRATVWGVDATAKTATVYIHG